MIDNLEVFEKKSIIGIESFGSSILALENVFALHCEFEMKYWTFI
jgi:hypothetical protein